MEIHLNLTATDDQIAIAIGFKTAEINFALAVLKGINKSVQAAFIQKAIDHLEEHLRPKALPMINYFHTCIHCTRSIDERDDNTMCISKEGDTKWQCRTCKPLKQHRPV